jgi:hypothetical protein
MLHRGLERRRMNDNVQQETQRVDQDVPLATFDLLARDRPFGIGQITGVTITKATAVRRKAVFGCPHRALLKRESSARQGITSDSSDSRTSRIGSEVSFCFFIFQDW